MVAFGSSAWWSATGCYNPVRQLPMLSVYLLPSSYETYQQIPLGSLLERSSELARGTIIAVRPSPPMGWPEMAQAITAVAERHARAPMCLWLDLVTRKEAITATQRCRLLGVRAVIDVPILDKERLRDQLSDMNGFERDVVPCCRRFGLRVDAAVAERISLIAVQADRYRTFAGLSAALMLNRPMWRASFKTRDLGSPTSWFRVLRLVKIATAIQRDPNRTVADIAVQFEFFDDAAVRRQLRAVLGAAPSDARSHLGWEWILADGLRRAGIRA